MERSALQRRVDLQVLRFDIEAQARQYGLNQASRLVTDFELAGADSLEKSKSVRTNDEGETEVEVEKVKRRGFEVEFTIPIYDFGATSMRNVQEAYMAAANRLAERAVNARSEVREAYFRYRGNYDLARYYQSRVLPLRQTIQDEALLQYSGMLIDVNQLITDARARILSNVDAINARRDFWIAATDMQAALIGGGAGGGGGEGGGETATAAAGGEAGGGH
jgi:outer membrane protein TolC